MATKLILQNSFIVGFSIILEQLNGLMFNQGAKELGKIDFFKDNGVDDDFLKKTIIATFVAIASSNTISYINFKNDKLKDKIKDDSFKDSA